MPSQEPLTQGTDTAISAWKWESVETLAMQDAFDGTYLANLKKYGLKMALDLKMQGEEGWILRGNRTSVSLCNDIFGRIDSLRKKSTRPMKERALVDLFRELRSNGFTTNVKKLRYNSTMMMKEIG